jgi:hypothetical protein
MRGSNIYDSSAPYSENDLFGSGTATPPPTRPADLFTTTNTGNTMTESVPPPPFGQPSWAASSESAPPRPPLPNFGSDPYSGQPNTTPNFSGGGGLRFSQLDPALAAQQAQAAQNAPGPKVYDPGAEIRAGLLSDTGDDEEQPAPTTARTKKAKPAKAAKPKVKLPTTRRRNNTIRNIALLFGILIIAGALAFYFIKGRTPDAVPPTPTPAPVATLAGLAPPSGGVPITLSDDSKKVIVNGNGGPLIPLTVDTYVVPDDPSKIRDYYVSQLQLKGFKPVNGDLPYGGSGPLYGIPVPHFHYFNSTTNETAILNIVPVSMLQPSRGSNSPLMQDLAGKEAQTFVALSDYGPITDTTTTPGAGTLLAGTPSVNTTSASGTPVATTAGTTTVNNGTTTTTSSGTATTVAASTAPATTTIAVATTVAATTAPANTTTAATTVAATTAPATTTLAPTATPVPQPTAVPGNNGQPGSVPTPTAVITVPPLVNGKVPLEVLTYVADCRALIGKLKPYEDRLFTTVVNPYLAGKIPPQAELSKLFRTSVANMEMGQYAYRLSNEYVPDGAYYLSQISIAYAQDIDNAAKALDQFFDSGKLSYLDDVTAYTQQALRDRTRWNNEVAKGYPYNK